MCYFQTFLVDTYTCPILGATDIPVMSPLGFIVGSALPTLQRRMWCTFPEIHL